MMFKNKLFMQEAPQAAALVVLASMAALIAALIAQLGFYMKPCVLCVYQRVPYLLIMALGLIAYGTARQDKKISLFFLALCGVIFIIGSAIAFFHVGVEQGWWSGTGECGGDLADADISLEELRLKVLSAPIVRCDEAAWRLFGISMAGYNVAYSLVLGLYSFLVVKKGLKKGF